MKKYVKPIVEIEEFALTQSVAACAGLQINLMNRGCVLNDNDAPSELKGMANAGLFMDMSGSNPCWFTPQDMDQGDKYCFHTAINIVFTSQ